jgi:hypothetical protein
MRISVMDKDKIGIAASSFPVAGSLLIRSRQVKRDNDADQKGQACFCVLVSVVCAFETTCTCG